MTLRLTDEEEKALISIKDSLGCSTLSGAIKHLISFHNDLTKNFDEMAQTAQAAIHERDVIKEEVATYLGAQNNLAKMVTPEWHDEVMKRLEAHEQGRSVTYSLEETKSILKEHLNELRD